VSSVPADAADHAATVITGQLTIPAPRDVWNEMLEGDPDVLVSQTPEWIDAVCSDRRHEDASRLYTFPDGKRLLLPAVRRRGVWPRRNAPWESSGDGGMGGFVEDPGISEVHRVAVFRDLAAIPAVQGRIRPNPPKDSDWEPAVAAGAQALPRFAFAVDLDGGADAVWARFKSGARGRIRKAEKAGVVIECDRTGAMLPVFYELLEKSAERWSLQQHEPHAIARWRLRRRDPLAKLERYAEQLGAAWTIWVARSEGVPVASIVVLQGKNAQYIRGAMDKELASPVAANEALQWAAIQDCCEKGCRWYQMGETRPDGPLAQFKTKFGAQPQPYHEYRFERLPLTATDHRLRSLAKRVLRVQDA
jgi:hypothetical protein